MVLNSDIDISGLNLFGGNYQHYLDEQENVNIRPSHTGLVVL
jgi:hypothetical protein